MNTRARALDTEIVVLPVDLLESRPGIRQPDAVRILNAICHAFPIIGHLEQQAAIVPRGMNAHYRLLGSRSNGMAYSILNERLEY